MSLLLALTDTGGGGVTGAATSSQTQTTAITGAAAVAAVTGTADSSQAQTSVVSGSFSAIGVIGSGTSSQAQTTAASGVTTVASVSGTVTTSQAQTSALAGSASPASVSGTNATSQAQTTALSGSFAGAASVSGVGSSSQGQASSAAGSVEGGGISYSGEVILTRKKIYVKRGKQYLIFNNNQEADAYLAAEDAIEAAKKSSRGAAKRVIKALKVVKPTIAPEPKLEELSALLAKFEVKRDIQTLQKNNDIEALYHIQSMLYALQQDEEDIEFLLLAI